MSVIFAGVTFTAAAENKVVVVPLGHQGPPAPVPKSGQTVSLRDGDDGDNEVGVTWPNPRFEDHMNGTVTDKLTGLIWQKSGNCRAFFPLDFLSTENLRSWTRAIISCNALSSGFCGLSDGSKAGDWRLPNLKELDSLIDLGRRNPYALSADCPLADSTLYDPYWSSTNDLGANTLARYVWFETGCDNWGEKTSVHAVRCVRGGQK